jgi:hypothetical protein
MIRWLRLTFFVSVLAGCASTTTVQSQVSAPKEQVLAAAVKAVVSAGFQVTHTDSTVGVITASCPLKQALSGREAGGSIRLTVLVSEAAAGSRLNVVWTPPSGALGSFKSEQAELIRYLKSELPGVEIK